MKVAIIGSGNMANGIGIRLISGGHVLTIYDRNEEKAKNLVKKLGKKTNAKKLGEKISEDLVILALPYLAIPQVLKNYKREFSGKIIVDISNPLNWQTMELLPPKGSSGAQEISKYLPKGTKFLKAFNTTFSGTLPKGKVAGKPLDVFVVGDDEKAKRTLMKIIKDAGLRPLDVGGLEKAHFLEVLGLVHILLQSKLGNTWLTALKILP